MTHQRHEALSSRISAGSYFAAAGALLVVVFAWLEPAGASQLGFLWGVLFWSLQMAVLIPLLVLFQKGASTLIPGMNPWLTTLLVGVFVSVLFAPLAYAFDSLFGVPEIPPSASRLEGILDELQGVAPPVTLVWLGLNAPWIIGLNFRPSAPSETGSIENSSTMGGAGLFLDLVAKEIGGEIISVSSELHYLRVRTSVGSGMLLYNLRDAVREMVDLPGVQIHRSHWVAQRHITRILRRDGQKFCVLTDGTELPISRRRHQEVADYVEQATRASRATEGSEGLMPSSPVGIATRLR